MPSSVNDTIPNDGDFILATPIRTNFEHIKTEITALQARPSGAGTITGVTAGTALTGGGTTGSVTLNVDIVPVANGGTGATSAVAARTALGAGTGSVTSVSTGPGLSGGPVTGIGTISISTVGAAEGYVLTFKGGAIVWAPSEAGPAAQVPVVTVGSISGVAGTAIAMHQVVASNPPITNWAVTPALPANLSLNASNGQITGTPIATQAASLYTVTATNAQGPSTGTNNLTITVAATLTAPVVTAGQIVSGTEGTAITAYQIQTTGGEPTSFTPTPALPTGLSLSATGLITGIPAAGTDGSHTIGIVAGNAAGNSPSVNITITIAAAVTPGGWQVTYSFPTPPTNFGAGSTIPLTSFTGWQPAYAADMTDDLYDVLTPAAMPVRLFARYTPGSEVEVDFDNWGGTSATNKVTEWGYHDGNIIIYGSNSTGNPIALRLVKS